MTDPNAYLTSLNGTERALLTSCTPAAEAGACDSDVPAQCNATITGLRARIDALDAELIGLWSERSALSRRVAEVRLAAGGPRRDQGREREIVRRFRMALGMEGGELALLLLRAGRGPL